MELAKCRLRPEWLLHSWPSSNTNRAGIAEPKKKPTKVIQIISRAARLVRSWWHKKVLVHPPWESFLKSQKPTRSFLCNGVLYIKKEKKKKKPKPKALAITNKSKTEEKTPQGQKKTKNSRIINSTHAKINGKILILWVDHGWIYHDISNSTDAWTPGWKCLSNADACLQVQCQRPVTWKMLSWDRMAVVVWTVCLRSTMLEGNTFLHCCPIR